MEHIENHKILETKIIGKEDVDIAKMIQKLQNYDWLIADVNIFDAIPDIEKNI